MIASVVDRICDLDVQVEHIPGGCTGMCQPVDVGIGKLLKNYVQKMWEDWMVKQNPRPVAFCPPSRETVANWEKMATFKVFLFCEWQWK